MVELASPSDEGPRGLSALREKMAAYQDNGARLGWLLLPLEQAVEAWPASHPPPGPAAAGAASGAEGHAGLPWAIPPAGQNL